MNNKKHIIIVSDISTWQNLKRLHDNVHKEDHILELRMKTSEIDNMTIKEYNIVTLFCDRFVEVDNHNNELSIIFERKGAYLTAGINNV